MPTKEQFLDLFPQALEMSERIGAPAKLLPTDLGEFASIERLGNDLSGIDPDAYMSKWWTLSEETILVRALSERFHVDVGILGAAVASALQRTPEETLELSEYPDDDGNVIYIQVSQRHHVFAIGAPGFDFGD